MKTEKWRRDLFRLSFLVSVLFLRCRGRAFFGCSEHFRAILGYGESEDSLVCAARPVPLCWFGVQ